MVLLERPRHGECAVLVSLRLNNEPEPADLEEFTNLARSAGAQPVAVIAGARQTPDSAYFVGTGKLEEIRQAVTESQAEVVLFNHSLSPAQGRNLEKALSCRVLDRTEVILDIFAQRARSFEGKLQVELAQLQHLSTRLVRGWTHLERQKGGIGLRGPGETQLETDRRLLGNRIKQINKRLEKVERQRAQHRRARERAELPTVALVGYTNAGKSTLSNALTQATVYAADQLFATLDPTLRYLVLPSKATLVLADTVGFVQQLPHDLVAAFRATLDETCQADILLHVVDAHDPERQQRISQVNAVLSEIGAADVPQILVYNKIDQLSAAEQTEPHLERNSEGHFKVWLSAAQGTGLDFLLQALTAQLPQQIEHHLLHIPTELGHIRARLHQLGKVLHEHFEENGDCVMDIEIEARHFAPLSQHLSVRHS